ncbi:PDZ domain-containing protein [Bremerella cremea]|uniref:PDZ domain-containing protein n=1 Tax=Bremerella cremea TaxID=1031537 RepID=A0A368KRH3_9BACT|nr:site-2 protease family protein [Bremerella cremea]RCS46118.1 PDZ domain-containing protein [Bremerella cremea]
MGLGLVIFVHELGHFLVAKACGVRCDKFYVGFDVPITIGPWTISSLWKKQWGETEYGIGTIPLGGYVKMLGQDDNPGNSEEESVSTMIETVDDQGNKQTVVNPRSYTAKSVPQRMAIISAGVVFNLIFGVIFAAIAYNLGVSYTPAKISWVQPGSPAWQAGMRPGDQIVGLNAEGKDRKDLRYRKDMSLQIAFNGSKKPMPFVVKRPDGTQEVLMIQPRPGFGDSFPPTIGVLSMSTTKMMVAPKLMEGIYGKKIADEMKPGDQLIAINDTPIESYLEYQKYVANHPYDVLKMKFDRKVESEGDKEKTEQVEIDLPTIPYRSTGLVMEMSPVIAIRKGGPADKVGIQVDDKIVSIDGEPVGDGFTLPSRETKWAGKTVDVVVKRGEEEKTFSVETAVPEGFAEQYYPGYQMGLQTLGVSYNLGTTVAEVLPGSSAEKEGIKAGDEILVVGFQSNSEKAKEYNDSMAIGTKDFKIQSEGIAWQAVQMALQIAAPDTSLILTVQKKGAEISKNVAVTATASETEMLQTRYLRFAPLQAVQYADSFADSLALGVREVGEGMTQVVMVLRKIATGEMQISGLGGPGTILYAATAESSHGLARLLTFLTLISANLAVVNFLPIPVLDGGHMMFLLYEGIRGKPINEKWMLRLTYVGLAMVLTMMVTVIGLDIHRFFPWG